MSPSVRDWRLFADDIIEACGKIRRYVAGMSYEAFVGDELRRDAAIRNIEIIGEAAKNLPDEVVAQAPTTLRDSDRVGGDPGLAELSMRAQAVNGCSRAPQPGGQLLTGRPRSHGHASSCWAARPSGPRSVDSMRGLS
jgi:ribonuclease HepT-like protein